MTRAGTVPCFGMLVGLPTVDLGSEHVICEIASRSLVKLGVATMGVVSWIHQYLSANVGDLNSANKMRLVRSVLASKLRIITVKRGILDEFFFVNRPYAQFPVSIVLFFFSPLVLGACTLSEMNTATLYGELRYASNWNSMVKTELLASFSDTIQNPEVGNVFVYTAKSPGKWNVILSAFRLAFPEDEARDFINRANSVGETKILIAYHAGGVRGVLHRMIPFPFTTVSVYDCNKGESSAKLNITVQAGDEFSLSDFPYVASIGDIVGFNIIVVSLDRAQIDKITIDFRYDYRPIQMIHDNTKSFLRKSKGVVSNNFSCT